MTDARSLAAVASIWAAIGLGFAADSTLAQNPRSFIAQSELFTNVTVIDGRGGPPRPGSAVLVWGGKIRGIGSRGQMTVPQGTTVVDLAGSYVVPGFIDVYASPRTAEELREMLAMGITGVREGATPLAEYETRGRRIPGEDPLPTVYIGGPVLEAGPGATGVALESEEAAVSEVARQIGDGARFITTSAAFPADWLVGIARAARRLDTPVWSDRGRDGWLLSLRAGVDVASPLISGDAALLPEAERAAYLASTEAAGSTGLAEWLDLLDPAGPEVDRAISALLSRDASVIPLLAAVESRLVCAPESAACPPASEEERQAFRAVWPTARSLVRTLYDEGVRLLVGSHAPPSAAPGRGFHREMELLVQSGIPPLDVLSMASRNGAIALGQLHERGTLEIGKEADFVVLDADPTADIRNATRVSLVFLKGRAWRVNREGRWERVRF